MGMYTELNMSAIVEPDENTLLVLRYMVGDEEVLETDIENIIPKHRLFELERGCWAYMLCCDSFYFDHTAHSELVNRHNVDAVLNVRCDLKDYEDEIKHFLNLIYSFSPTRGFVGYTRYEEADNPTLIYFTDKGVEYKEVN